MRSNPLSLLGASVRIAGRAAVPASRSGAAVMLKTARASTRLGVQAVAGAATVGKVGAVTAGKVGVAAAKAGVKVGVEVGVDAAGPVVARTESLARHGRETAAALSQELVWAGRDLADLHERRRRRRVWTRRGRAHIEVRGLGRKGVPEGVTKSLRRLRGVRWAEVNAVTGQVLVAFDEGRVDVAELLDAVRDVEAAHGTRTEDFPWERAAHPGDRAPVAVATAELAADCVALTAAVAEWLFRLPPLPPRVRLAIAVFEVEKGLRGRLKRRIGPIETDLVLTLVNAAVHGLSEGVATPAVDAVYRTLLLAETWERRKVWGRREADLCANPASVPREPPKRPDRPRPRPPGPIEAWTDRLGPAAPAAAAAALAFTRSPGRAANALLAATPKAAMYGRGAFAAVIGRNLARRDILPMNAAVFRRFDRVSAIVIDSAALRGTGTGVPASAEAILTTAAAGGATVLVTDEPGITGLLPAIGGELLDTGDDGIAGQVRRLQEADHGVLVISRTDDTALAAADVGIAVPAPDGTVCWSADLICRDDLTDVQRVLRTVAVARTVSAGAVRLAQAGSTLGGVLSVTGGVNRRTSFVLAPVHLTTVASMTLGVVTGLRATREQVPR